VSWTVYWFMLPVCIMIATAAMFSGISGAALLTPTFLIGFPLLSVPRLGTVAAIGTSLFLETSGFGTGLFRYLRARLVDLKTAKSLIFICFPLGVLGSIIASRVPADLLRLGYGIAMLGLAYVLLQDSEKGKRASNQPTVGPGAPEPAPLIVCESGQAHPNCRAGAHRQLRAASGKVYDFCAHGLGLQRAISGGGALVAGMISTGVGEATLPPLVRRSKFPVPVAAATSTVVVAFTVAGAAVTHFVELIQHGGLSAIPWNLLVYAVPGAIIGAFIGTRLQGRVSEKAARLFFAGLFAAIGLAFLLAFTVFKHRFS
jgi:uncharacterized membrane protein YfcA